MILIQFLLPLRLVGKHHYRAYMTFALTFVFFAVFAWEVILTSQGGMPIEAYLEEYAFATCEIGEAAPSELLVDGVRALFMTTSLPEMLINLLFLWIFAPLVEQFLGKRRFLAFFILVGLIGYVFAAWAMRGQCVIIVGPNSAVAGVIAAFIFLFPNKRIETAFRPFLDRKFDFPAFFFGLNYLTLQFIADGGGPLSGEFLPVWDEVGGFLFGFLAIFLITAFFKPAPKTDAFEYLDDE